MKAMHKHSGHFSSNLLLAVSESFATYHYFHLRMRDYHPKYRCSDCNPKVEKLILLLKDLEKNIAI